MQKYEKIFQGRVQTKKSDFAPGNMENCMNQVKFLHSLVTKNITRYLHSSSTWKLTQYYKRYEWFSLPVFENSMNPIILVT